MKNIRIIARLDIKGPDMVKGIHLEGLRVLGNPGEFARYYYETGADELFYQDVVASLYGRNSLHDMITKTAKEVFIPLTVGGGIRTIDDIKKVLRAGADKVSINTAAIADPDFVKKAARQFGSSTIVASVEAIKGHDGKYIACSDNGREESRFDAVEWACRLAELGAGELLITSVDREGTGEGFDIDLVRQIATAVTIPVVAHGGAAKPAHVSEVILEGKADAVAIAGMFHYAAMDEMQAVAGSHAGNVEFISAGRKVKAYREAVSIPLLKNFLLEKGISVRS